jgi:hypothetical protein
LGSPLRNLVLGVFYMLVVMTAAVLAYVANSLPSSQPAPIRSLPVPEE